MRRYLAIRLLHTIPILWGVVTLVFLAMRLVPGDPAQVALGEYARQEAIQALREEMGLSRPLWSQYVAFLGGLARGDLGQSYITKRSIRDDLARELPFTVDLTVASTLLSLIVGIPLGIVSALRRNSAIDYIARTAALIGLSIPPFYLGIVLLLVFALYVPVFPIIGGGEIASVGSRLHHLVLPAVSLGLITASFVARMTRATMFEVLNEDYVRTARAKGLRERLVIARHAFRNALIPVITVVGLYLGVTLSGSVLTETVFNRPGLGRFMVGAILKRDYTIVQSTMVLFAAFVVFVNLAVDLAYGLADPRIRYE